MINGFGIFVVEDEAFFRKKRVIRPKLLRIGGTLPDRYRSRASVLYVNVRWNHETNLPIWLDEE